MQGGQMSRHLALDHTLQCLALHLLSCVARGALAHKEGRRSPAAGDGGRGMEGRPRQM